MLGGGHIIGVADGGSGKFGGVAICGMFGRVCTCGVLGARALLAGRLDGVDG